MKPSVKRLIKAQFWTIMAVAFPFISSIVLAVLSNAMFRWIGLAFLICLVGALSSVAMGIAALWIWDTNDHAIREWVAEADRKEEAEE